MGIRYYKLFDMLNRKGMKKSDLREILSPNTIAKLSKGEHISGEVIEKICQYLECQPGDIMEYVYDAVDGYTGEEVEIAEHETWEENPLRPDPDGINVYYKDNPQKNKHLH